MAKFVTPRKRIHQYHKAVRATVGIPSFKNILQKRAVGYRSLMTETAPDHYDITILLGDKTAVLLLTPEEAERVHEGIGSYLELRKAIE